MIPDPQSLRLAVRALLLCACAALPVGGIGCSTHDSAGAVRLTSVGTTQLVLDQPFSEGAYTTAPSETDFWLANIPLATLTNPATADGLADAVFLHAQLLWVPEPGKTPIAATATNLVTRVIVLSGGELGIYGGAAFAEPVDGIGDEVMRVRIRGGTLTLLHRTSGFRDLLSPATLDGTIRANLSTEDAAVWERAVSQLATNRLGESIFVEHREAADTTGADHALIARHQPD